MIAVDTNVLVYAHRRDSPWHDAASALLRQLAEGRAAWAIPWPCVHEFLAVVTHPRIYRPPSPLEVALAQVDAWMESPVLVLAAEGPAYWPALRSSAETGRATGPAMHDARVAALCVSHGIRELWTADRDFDRFPGVRARNPLVRTT
ncbi:MAG: TA system VapC family ribonuclease toxin [Vicinamibacterales bacterium]